MTTILPLLIAFGGLLFGAVFMFIGWYLWYEGQDLRSSGLTVRATVLRKFRKADQGLWGNLESFYAQCQFRDITGQSREVDVYMGAKRWYQVSEGATTMVTYVPNEVDEPLPGSRFGWQLRGFIGISMMTLGMLLILILTVGGVQEWLASNQAF